MAEATSFGRYIRRRRVEAGLSLRAVADRLGISHVYLGEVERGVRPPFVRERWDALVSAIPGVSIVDLERHAATSRPLQLDLNDAAPQYSDLALALARRIEDRQAPRSEEEARKINELLVLLRGSHDE